VPSFIWRLAHVWTILVVAPFALGLNLLDCKLCKSAKSLYDGDIREAFVESPAHLLSQPYRSVWLFLRSFQISWWRVLWTYVRDCYWHGSHSDMKSLCMFISKVVSDFTFERVAFSEGSIAGGFVYVDRIESFLSCRFICIRCLFIIVLSTGTCLVIFEIPWIKSSYE
jgi:hypothetical protein